MYPLQNLINIFAYISPVSINQVVWQEKYNFIVYHHSDHNMNITNVGEILSKTTKKALTPSKKESVSVLLFSKEGSYWVYPTGTKNRKLTNDG